MERIISQDERIRRAEEIYARRQMLREKTKRATVNVSKPRNFKLLKKLVLQITICLLMYFIFYLINTTDYSFSEQTLNKTEELISKDLDFISLYNDIAEKIKKYMGTNILQNSNMQETNQIEENTTQENIVPTENGENANSSENVNAQGTNNDENLNVNNNESDNSDLSVVDENESTGQQELSYVNMSETDRIKLTYSFINPVKGYVTSEFGTRESTSSIVSTYHKGIDVGAVIGTDIVAATSGKVVISKKSQSYGNYIMIEQGEVKTVYAHCSKLLANVGDEVSQGQKIAEVRRYWECNRTTFAF